VVILDSPGLQDSPAGTDPVCLVMTLVTQDCRDFLDMVLMDRQDSLDTPLGRQATLLTDTLEVPDHLDIRLMDTERQFRLRRSPSIISENILCA